MISAALLRRFDGWRLTLSLALIFSGLAVPTGVLTWQAYGQLKWEAYYRYRGMAEELTRRIDDGLREHVLAAEQRSFADYSFLVLAGDPSANFVQRSPLAGWPVDTGPPGTIGYFQVDAEGDFSTPLLPPEGTDPAAVGIDAKEYARRLELADRLRAILADNRLVRHRRLPAESEYTQRAFDELERPAAESAAAQSPDRERVDRDTLRAASPPAVEVVVGKVADLNLEPAYRDEVNRLEAETGRPSAPLPEQRAKRREQTALPEADAAGERTSSGFSSSRAPLRISTFESEVDPFEFSLLDSGHFVLFRNVWRDDQRYIQGMLIDPDAFLEAVTGPFEGAALAGMSDLVISWYDNVLRGPGRRETRAADSGEALEGTLLYRGHLSAPLDSLGLIFSIRHLPPGPGARVLGWATLVLGIVFLGGFYALHRLARGQLRLARQQQDFVSAVSHELKTPLTSIRMYGEMLKEGWAPEDKRRQYYEYIHDESERLTRLISNVLQLASITRNETHPTMQPVSVGELMHRLEERLGAQAERSGFELAFDRDEQAEGATLLLDEDCFLQVVINLVDNAIKFSAGAGKRIEIGSRLVGRARVVFSVRDYGPGVPRDQMKKIFGLFYRSGDELTRETVGTGIGLAIVHQLTRAMHGSVDVVNREPGAEFRVSFPVHR